MIDIDSDMLFHGNFDVSAVDLTLTKDIPVCDTEAIAGDSTRSDNGESYCSPLLALSAIELSLQPDILQKYKAAYLLNWDCSDDQVYLTWKSYKDRCSSMCSNEETDGRTEQTEETPVSTTSRQVPISNDIGEPTSSHQGKSALKNITAEITNTTNITDDDSDILVNPQPQIRRKSKRNMPEKFFILTSEQAYQSKLKQKEEREKRENEKELKSKKKSERQVQEKTAKENKKTSKPKTVNQANGGKKKCKMPKQSETATSVGVGDSLIETPAVDTTPCMYCEQLYCESDVDWFQCKTCEQWSCLVCSRLGKKKKNKNVSFVCDTCKPK